MEGFLVVHRTLYPSANYAYKISLNRGHRKCSEWKISQRLSDTQVIYAKFFSTKKIRSIGMCIHWQSFTLLVEDSLEIAAYQQQFIEHRAIEI